MNNLSNQEWTDIANNINDLVNRNISIANLNNKDINSLDGITLVFNMIGRLLMATSEAVPCRNFLLK